MNMSKLEIGTPLYICRGLFGKIYIETEWVISINGDWVRLGYANHPDALRSNSPIENALRSHSFTPEQAVQKYKEHMCRQHNILQDQIERAQKEQEELLHIVETLSVDDLEVRVHEYDPLDAIF